MILGPTEHRVARYLEDACRHGRVTIRTTAIVGALGVERSEVYRITRRLRMLGLFGIEDDRSGARGGRRYWRTATTHDGGLAGLDPVRHRVAWARIVSAARARRAQVLGALGALRLRRSGDRLHDAPPATPAALASPPVGAAGVTFADLVWGASGPPGWWHELGRRAHGD